TEIGEPQAPVVAAPPKKNVFARIAGVLFTPAETFREIAQRPDVLAPMLLMLAIGFITALLIVPRLDVEALMAAQSEQLRAQNPNMTDADIERMEKFAAAGAKVFSWLSPFFSILFYVAVAAVLLFAFRLMAGEGNFTQALSVTLYAWTPLLLFSIVMTIVVVARGAFDPTTAASLVKSNPAFLVDHKEQTVLYSLLSSFDVFTFWSLFLFIIGFATMSKLSKATSAAIVIGLWVAFIAVKLGFAAMNA
ncbi:MAG TPA: Yip1 family protein, partial [Thermoanaerobaculia bacterium]|nr:Yip1 family protein [Thermoanaerobaculia bacterium]